MVSLGTTTALSLTAVWKVTSANIPESRPSPLRGHRDGDGVELRHLIGGLFNGADHALKFGASAALTRTVTVSPMASLGTSASGDHDGDLHLLRAVDDGDGVAGETMPPSLAVSEASTPSTGAMTLPWLSMFSIARASCS